MKILAFIAAFICCNISNAQIATATIKGKVVNDATGKPLEAATVTVGMTVVMGRVCR